jgi:hemerythrin-like metal-binding protein
LTPPRAVSFFNKEADMSRDGKPPAPRVPRIDWKKEFLTGNPSIDHEHKQMIQLLNLLFAALQEKGGTGEVQEYLGHVFTKISAHFALEETLMKQRNYDQYEAHKADHERLLDEIRNIMDDCDSGKYSGMDTQLATRLEHWFVEHFKSMDSRLHRILDTP